QSQAESRAMIRVARFIHRGIEDFLDVHSGGRHLLPRLAGRDLVCKYFFFFHPADWLRLLVMKHAGILCRGVPRMLEDKLIPSSEWLHVVYTNKFRTSNVSPQ
ncbi:hypothetical protein J3R83DRAFT_11019, partial [Lanmaoa asiatica]